MIVKDKDSVIEMANELSNNMIDLMNREIANYRGEDDAVEIMYFIMHVLGNLNARTRIFLESSAASYGVDEEMMDVKDWLALMTEEYYNLNKGGSIE